MTHPSIHAFVPSFSSGFLSVVSAGPIEDGERDSGQSQIPPWKRQNLGERRRGTENSTRRRKYENSVVGEIVDFNSFPFCSSHYSSFQDRIYLLDKE